MRSMRTFSFVGSFVTLIACGLSVSSAPAIEVLSNGGFEMGAGPAGWTLTASVVGMPEAVVNATEQVDSANQEFPNTPGLGLLVKPYAGNRGDFAGQNNMVDVSLSQTFSFGSFAAGRTYTFTGHSFYQLDSSNNLETLGTLTPLGDYNLDTVVNAADYTVWRDTLGSTTDFRANGTNEGASLDLIDQADYDYWKERFGISGHGPIPSPTQTKFELAFLNASDVVIGTPATLNLPKNRPTDVFPDDWQLHTLAAVAPAGTTKIRVTVSATNMVDSCSICEAGQDVFFDNFSLKDSSLPSERLVNGDLNAPGAPIDFTLVKSPEDNVQFTNASYAVHTGNQGLWLRSFNGGDAKVVQTVDGTAGADYDFSAWVKLQGGYSGFDPLSSTVTFMTMEFLDAASAVIDTQTLDLDDVVPYPTDPQGEWNQFSLNGTAPANTVSIRVSLGATGMANSGLALPQSAMFDDLSLIETLPGAGSLAAVPEPSSLMLLSILCGVICVGRHRS